MTLTSPISILVTLLGLAFSSLSAQTSVSTLRASVDAYLGSQSDEEAERRLTKILDGAPSAEELLEAVKAPPEEIPVDQDFPWLLDGSTLRIRVRAPAGHTRDAKPLPVILDLASGGDDWYLVPDIDVIRVAAVDISPAPGQFSDLGRDVATLALRIGAWAANGDLESLWMIGFSWSGHATSDTAHHRPDVLRGIIPMGGGPRRKHFRLNPNLVGTEILALCGGKDDPELIWNLRELERITKKEKLSYRVVIDPNLGHQNALQGRELIGPMILEAKPRRAWPPRGRLFADAARVENRWLRIDAIDEKRVAVPRRIPVSARLSPDQQRQATIRAMAKKVVSLDWRIDRNEKTKALKIKLKSRGVRRATVLIPASMIPLATNLQITGSKPAVRRHALELDPRVLLEEARRLGARLDPIVARYEISF